MATIGDTWKESLRVISASEKVNALAWIVTTAHEAVTRVREAAPELDPELSAIEDRISEIADHLEATTTVLAAQLDILQENIGKENP